MAMLVALAALAALTFDGLAAADARVAAVAWRLQTANVALCPKTEPLSGMSLHMLDQYPPGARAEAVSRYHLGDAPALSVVVNGSAAARVGLRPGDAITAIDGAPTPRSVPGKARYDHVAAAQAMLEHALADASAELEIGGARHVVLTGDPGCASRVELAPAKGLNASADGRTVQIGGKLYALAASDDELAAAIAHELAHNILEHRAALKGVSRGLFAGLGRNGQRLRASEDEADTLGVRLVQGAGYDPRAVASLWRKLARVGGPSFLSDGTHPGWKKRIARAQAAAGAQ